MNTLTSGSRWAAAPLTARVKMRRSAAEIWTEANVEILKDMFPTYPAQDIADAIGCCCQDTVRKKARELGLTKADGYSRDNFKYRFTKKGRYKEV
jgi:hypothetical protein